MFDLWKDELTEEETEALLDQVVDQVKKRKMELPAMLMLETHAPVAFVGTQAAIAFSPFIVPFLGFDAMNNFTRLFSKRENIDKLIARLEQAQLQARNDSEDACNITT